MSTASGQASAWRQLPNVLTALRLVLVPPILILLVESRYGIALALVIVAGISDALDGWLARRGDLESEFGAFFDKETDAFDVDEILRRVRPHVDR